MKNKNSVSERFHGLDLARAFLMISVLIYHSSRIFDTNGTWRVFYFDQAEVFTFLSAFFNIYIMPAFFILTGFFFHLVYARDGFKKALQSRFLRLFIPMVFVGFTLNTYANWVVPSKVAYTPHENPAQYVIYGDWLGHLWFLGNLIIYNLFSFAFIWAIEKLDILNLQRWNKLIVIIGITLAMPIFCMACIFVALQTYQEEFLFITFFQLFSLLPYYILGLFFYRYRDVFKYLLRPQIYMPLLVIGCVAYVAIVQTYTSGIIYNYFYGLLALTLSLAVIGIMNQIGQKESRIVKSFSNASYTIYLLHQPLLILTFALFVIMGLPAPISFIGIIALVLSATFLFHHYCIRNSKMLSLLFNGVYKK